MKNYCKLSTFNLYANIIDICTGNILFQNNALTWMIPKYPSNHKISKFNIETGAFVKLHTQQSPYMLMLNV